MRKRINEVVNDHIEIVLHQVIKIVRQGFALMVFDDLIVAVLDVEAFAGNVFLQKFRFEKVLSSLFIDSFFTPMLFNFVSVEDNFDN